MEQLADGTTQLLIQLPDEPQKNNMEPINEPTRIRVDDNAKVRIRLENLSPLDVCSLNGRTPTPTAETNVGESMVGTIAKLGGFSLEGAFKPGEQLAIQSMEQNQQLRALLSGAEPKAPKDDSKALRDKEYDKILAVGHDFVCSASQLIDKKIPHRGCKENEAESQADFAASITEAITKTLPDYAGNDYRGPRFTNFDPSGPGVLDNVRKLFTDPVPSIVEAGRLQAMVDEITTWALDLHKKYDFKVPAADSSSQASATIVPAIVGAGVVFATPAALSFTYNPENPAEDQDKFTQTLHASVRGPAARFTVTQSAPTLRWLRLEVNAETAPENGTYDIKVTVDPRGLAAGGKGEGSITISGAAPATGTTIGNVTLKPADTPSVVSNK